MKIFLLFLFILSTSTTFAEEDRRMWTEVNGEFTWPEWQLESGWQNITFDEKFSDEIVQKIKSCSDVEFILFTAAWCHDSRIGTPKIIQLLKETGHYPSQIRLFGVDKEKNEPSGNNFIYAIEKVPTLIILRKEQEIGRIVEYPESTWDEEILNIIED